MSLEPLTGASAVYDTVSPIEYLTGNTWTNEHLYFCQILGTTISYTWSIYSTDRYEGAVHVFEDVVVLKKLTFNI